VAHAEEWGLAVPEEPLLFLKPSTAVIGPRDPIQLLPISRRIDYEGELGVVIGRLARGVRAEEAFKYILGYTCGNDVTLRDLQKKDDQWARAKGFDGSAPLGPWIETDLDPNDFAEGTSLVEALQRAGVVEEGSDEAAYLAAFPSGLQEAVRALLHDNLVSDAPLDVTFSWAPGYDDQVSLWQVADGERSAGGITIFVRSRFPEDRTAPGRGLKGPTG
jgi:hypothetical protein